MRDSKTRFASLFVFVAVLVLCLSMASSAFAWGAGLDSAYPLNGDAATVPPVPSVMGSSLTTDLVIGGIAPTGHYYMRAELTAGQTLNAVFTPGPGVVNLKVFALPYADGYSIVNGVTDPSTGIATLSFMASKTSMYNIYAGASSMGTFTVAPNVVSPIAYKVGAMSVSSKPRVKRTSYTSATLYPRYNGSRVPVKFYVQRRVSGRWKAYTSKTAYVNTITSTSTKFSAKWKFSKKGTYRVRARFADAAHPTAKYNSYKTFYVK